MLNLFIIPFGFCRISVCNPYSDAVIERTNSDDIYSNRNGPQSIITLENFTCLVLRNLLENNIIKGHENDQSLPSTSSFLEEYIVLTFEAGVMFSLVSYVPRHSYIMVCI